MRWWMIFKILLHPIRYAQDRIDAWVMARVKRQPGPVVIGRRKVYIVPTRFGYGFAIMLLVMLAGAMNYSNSMAFALTFLLGGLGLVAMHETHGNLVNIKVTAMRVEPIFAGQIAHFKLQIENPSQRARYSIACAWPKQDEALDIADLPATESQPLVLPMPAERRGWLPAGTFSIWTEFPLGLFHAWTWMELEMQALVYPKPASGGLSPPGATGATGYTSGPQAGQDEFAGLRSYQWGDTPKSINWKSLPKTGAPMTKQFTETLDRELWLDFDSLNGLPPEQRLSQLCRWVLDAEADQQRYGLILPGTRIEPDHGANHEFRCLKALALFEAGGAAQRPQARAA